MMNMMRLQPKIEWRKKSKKIKCKKDKINKKFNNNNGNYQKNALEDLYNLYDYNEEDKGIGKKGDNNKN